MTANHFLYGKISDLPAFDRVMDHISGFSVERLADGMLLSLGLLLMGSLVLFYLSYHLSCLWYRQRMRQ